MTPLFHFKFVSSCIWGNLCCEKKMALQTSSPKRKKIKKIYENVDDMKRRVLLMAGAYELVSCFPRLFNLYSHASLMCSYFCREIPLCGLWPIQSNWNKKLYHCIFCGYISLHVLWADEEWKNIITTIWAQFHKVRTRNCLC